MLASSSDITNEHSEPYAEREEKGVYVRRGRKGGEKWGVTRREGESEKGCRGKGRVSLLHWFQGMDAPVS